MIAYVDGRSYIKQFEHTEQACRLISLNRKYASIEVQDNPSFQIKGIVVGTLSN
ncbi:MAG: S24 family peptidase [Lentilactobacillus diolivorans]|nr:S24 family peptidase [Lentilactobacillus diolivorans]